MRRLAPHATDRQGSTMTTESLSALIRTIPDYPKPGILFRDITTLIRDPAGLRMAIEMLKPGVQAHGVSLIAGIEARGFIFGAALAQDLGLGFVPIRKKDKLPGRTIGINYALEYGSDRIEIHADALGPGDRVAIVDDLIATGGTAVAATRLLRSTGAEVPIATFVVDLPDLGGAALLRAESVDVFSLLSFEGH